MVLSTIAASNGWSSMIDDLNREQEGATVIWTGKSFTTYEGELSSSSAYPIFVQELRSVDVELLDGDQTSRFFSCEEDYSCDSIYEPGYSYVGYVLVSHSDTWRIKFSGDVIGDSDVMIKQVPLSDDEGVLQLGLGCSGICVSLLFFGVGLIFALTLKSGIDNPVSLDRPI